MLKIKFKQLPYTMFFIVLLITLGILCSEFNRTQARQLKVDVQTVQNGSIQDRISKKVSGNKISYAISLFNSSNNDQNLSTIIVSIKPDELIPSGTPYMIGADKQGVNGWMKQLITGTSNSNDKSVKYLTNSFQNSQANELSIYNKSKSFRVSPADTLIRGTKNLAPTPPMGWNSWNWFGKKQINENVVREVIDAMVSSGLRDAGYKYVVVDGGWRDTILSPKGELRPNPQRFPHGIKVLADYAHSKGLKFGLHTVPGTCDCGGDRVGGYGHEEVQIQQFVNWSVDFIKLDKCKMDGGWNEKELKDVYFKWSRLLTNSGRNIALSISAYKFRDWNPEVSQMSRTTGDIAAKVNGGALFTGKAKGKGPADEGHFLSVLQIANTNNESARFAGNGYWNNPDMLVVGDQGLTVNEQKVHFSLWCIMSAPLILGNDPRHMELYEKKIILNKDCIQIDQDPTEQGRLLKTNGDIEVWVKHLKDKKVAVLLLNINPTESKNAILNLKDIGIEDSATLQDIYEDKRIGTFKNTFSSNIKPNAGLFLLVQ